MTSGTRKAAWIAGLVLGAVGLGTGIYFATKPKQTDGGSGGSSGGSSGGGGGGGGGGSGGAGGGGMVPPGIRATAFNPLFNPIYDAAKKAYQSTYAASIQMGNDASAAVAGFLAAVQAASSAGAKQTIDAITVAQQVVYDAYIANGENDFNAKLKAQAARNAANIG